MVQSESRILGMVIDRLYAVVAEELPFGSVNGLEIAMLTAQRPRGEEALRPCWHELRESPLPWQRELSQNLSAMLGNSRVAVAWADLSPTRVMAIGFAKELSLPLDQQEIDLLRNLEPHLHRCARLRRRIELRHRALDHLAVGILVSTSDGQLTYTNASAERLLEERETCLQLENGQLKIAGDQVANQALQDAIANTGRIGAFSNETADLPLAAGLRGKGRYRIRICAVGEAPWSDTASCQGTALILISDLNRSLGEMTRWLQSSYQLTATEARVARSLAEGYNVDDTATALGVQRSTVKSHLKHIFGKMAVRRQSELVRTLVLGSGSYVERPRMASSLHTEARGQQRPSSARPAASSASSTGSG